MVLAMPKQTSRLPQVTLGIRWCQPFQQPFTKPRELVRQFLRSRLPPALARSSAPAAGQGVHLAMLPPGAPSMPCAVPTSGSVREQPPADALTEASVGEPKPRGSRFSSEAEDHMRSSR